MNTVANEPRTRPQHRAAAHALTARIAQIDWFNVEEELNGYGCAMLRA